MTKKHDKCKRDPICGTTIDVGGTNFTECEPNLVYIDKVFGLETDTSCPLFFTVNTAECPENFDVTYESADINCNPCPLGPDSIFKINKSCGILEFIETKPPGNIDPNQVIIDGQPADDVTFENGRYLVDISTIISMIQNNTCQARGLPTKVFFLIRNVCCFQIRVTFVLEGTVNTGGRTCKFRAIISNAEEGPPIIVPTDCCTSFAIPKLAIPDVTNGNVPTISFRFSGTIKLINPELRVICNGPPPMVGGGEGHHGCCFPDDPFLLGATNCRLVLCSKVVVEPTVHVETVRRTLFEILGREGVPSSNPNIGEVQGILSDTTCANMAGALCGFRKGFLCGVQSVTGAEDDPCDDREEDVCEDLLDDICDEDEVEGARDNRDWNCPDVFGVNTGRRTRTCFQFSGNNGCCW
jgi:hypothetical protein